MLIGKPIFDAISLNDLVIKVEEGTYAIPTTLSREVVSFLNSMLQYKGENRLDAEKLSKHPFLTTDIRGFRRMNLRKAEKKFNNNGPNTNNTIWSIFSEDDEEILLNINEEVKNFPLNNSKLGSMIKSSLFPSFQSPSTFSIVSNIYGSSIISNNSNISNTHQIPKEYNYYPNIKNSFYGQNMHLNDQNIQKSQILPNQNRQIPNMGIQQQFPFKKGISGEINSPSKEMYNHYNFNQNPQDSLNQVNYKANIGNNNNKASNNKSQNKNIPMENIEDDGNECCII